MTENQNPKIKCLGCPTSNAQDAAYIIEDLGGVNEYFFPVCEEHLEEIIRQIEDLTVAKVIEDANKHFVFWQKRYENLLKEYSQLKKSSSIDSKESNT